MTETPASKRIRAGVIRNTAAQGLGRVVVALSRLAVASIVVRRFGRDVFGGYSLVVMLLSIAEGVLDFGVADYFVREVSREPERRETLFRAMTAARLVQIPVAYGFLAVVLFAMRYPSDVVRAGLTGGVGLVFFAAVLLCRVAFRADLAMDREVGAELVSVLATLAMLVPLARPGAGLTTVIGVYAASRAVFGAGCLALARGRYRLSVSGVRPSEVKAAIASSSAIGVVGFLVLLYETLDVLLLSRVSQLSEVASYSAAQRFIWPLLTSLTAIGGTLYPIAASYWPHDRERFENACRRAVDTGLILTGMAVCAILAASGALLRLLGPALAAGAPVLRILAIVLLLKAFSSTLGPVLYVVNAQRRVVRLAVLGIALKTLAIGALAPIFGAIGVASGTLLTEMVSAGCLVFMVRRHSGFRLSWSVPAKAGISAIAIGWGIRLTPLPEWVAAGLAVALYCAALQATGAAPVAEIRALLRRKAA